MANANPFSKEIQNGIRLSQLLINEGTSTLQKLFDREINMKFKSLSDAIHTKKAKLEQYYKGDRAKQVPKLLTYPQYKQLFPSPSTYARDSSTFDLTLLTLLLNIICDLPAPPSTKSWRHEPAKVDNSTAAQVIRLRNTRNKVYGHIKSTGISDDELKVQWDELHKILSSLGARQAQIDKWKTSPLDTGLVRETEKRLYTLIEHDIADVQAIGNTLLKVLDNLSHHLDDKLITYLEDIKSYISGQNKYDDFLAARIFDTVDTIGQNLNDHQFMLKMICQKEDTTAEEIMALRQEVLKLSNVPHMLQEQNDSLNAIDQKQFVIMEKLDEACSAIQNQPFTRLLLENSDLAKVRNMIESNLNSFKVLMITDPKPGVNFTNVAKALGLVPFNVVIDLDHHSLTSKGIYDDIMKILSKHKLVHTVTYKEFDKVSDDEKEGVATHKRTLWIQANGCSVKECEPSLSFFGRARLPTAVLLSSILKKIQVNSSVLCISVFLNATVQAQILQLEDGVNEACDMAHDVMTTPPHFVSLFCEEACLTRNENLLVTEDLQRLCATASENQLAFMFQELFSKDTEKVYSFPGDKGPCYLTSEEMALVLPMMDLYHKHIGEMNFEGLDPEEISEKIADVRDSYQKGSAITYEALFLDSSGRETIYVKRKSKEIKEMEATIKKYLDTRKDHGKYMEAGIVHHDACAGATTYLRHLLYTFKNEYPCTELTQMDPQVYVGLKIISSRSNLPLLIVAEGSAFSASDIIQLQNRLSNEWIQGLLIHSKRNRKTVTRPAGLKPGGLKFYISSNIVDMEDLSAFRDLYQRGVSNKRTQRVFLFGLLAFLKDYKKCDEHIQCCVSTLDPIQTNILRIVCYLWKYTHEGVKGRLLLKYFQSESFKLGIQMKEAENITELLGYGNDILVYNHKSDVLRPAVDFVANRALVFLDADDEAESLKNFTDDILQLTESDGDDKHDSSPLLWALFVRRDKDSSDHEQGNKFVQFITDLEKQCGETYVQGILERLIYVCNKSNWVAHCRTLYARYLMIKLNCPDDAILQIKQAFGLQDEESIRTKKATDHILLCAYGRLHEMKVRNCFTYIASAKSIKEALQMAEINIQEAVFAFRKAQESTKNSIDHRHGMHTPVPFWMEASARHHLLSLILQHICHNNIVQLQRYLRDTDDDFIKESITEGQAALDKLQLLIKLGKVQDDNPGLTFERIYDNMFKFLRLGVDHKLGSGIDKDPLKLRKAIERQSHSLAFDIGTLIRLEFVQGQRFLKAWEDLDKDDLEFIITEIDKRIASTHALAKNYQDIVTALINIRQLGCTTASKSTQGYNMKYALQCTTLWVKKYPKDYEAHFMHGVLTLVSGIEMADLKMLLDGGASLSKCREICESLKSTDSFRRKRFYICIGSGLEKIVPSKGKMAEEEVGRGKLEPFIGRLINDKEIRVQLGTFTKAFKATIPGWVQGSSNEVIAQAKQHPLVDFNCILTHDKIIAFNLKLHQSYTDEINVE